MSAFADDRTVVRTLVRLKLRLLSNGLRRSSERMAGYVIGSLVGLVVVFGISVGLFLLPDRSAADAATVLAAALTVMWAAAPLFLFSGDESADPTRLTMLPLRPRPLMRGTLLGALIGPGPVLALLLLTGCAVASAAGPAAVAAAVLGVPLATVTMLVLSRAVASANARMLSSRRGKDFAIFGGLLFAVLTQVGNLGVQSVVGHPGSQVDLAPLRPYAAVLRWVPPVSAVDSVRSAADGAYPAALAQLALTGGLLVLLVRWWLRSLETLMVTTDASTLVATRGRGGSWLWRLLPAGRAGAAMQRHLRYAWREPRAKAAIFTSIGMTVVFTALSLIQGWSSVYVLALGGLMLGLQTVNLFGMDGSAFWMVAQTIADERDARAELRGRALAVMVFAVPSVLVLAPVLGVATGQWAALPSALGLTLGALGVGLGLGGVLSVRAPYAMPVDSSPMRNAAPGQSGLVLLNGFGSMVGVALLTLPLGALLAALLLADLPTWPLLPVGLGYGALLAVLGVRYAARLLPGRLPEILAAAIER
ncbi:transporter [Kitasatospora sp. NPDC048365]|uniref:transporter n=1 Tax=Kitasatospora sp. NPDC048365 TaxID=3364050 RepID=UPI003712D405